MMKLWITLFAAVVLALFLPCAADAQETITGDWTAQLQPEKDRIHLRVRYGKLGHHCDWGSTRPLAELRGLDAATALAAERYAFQVEKNHSTVAFTIPIAGGLTKVTGKFSDFTADILWDSDDAAKSSVSATILAASINTAIEARDKDLRGPVFFDTAKFPQITYVSRKIEKRADRYIVMGDLTMKGVTKPVELTVVITGIDRGEKGDQAPILGVSATGKLNRLDFGIANDWKHTVIPNFLGNEIAIQIDLWTRGGKRAESTSANASFKIADTRLETEPLPAHRLP